MVLKSLPKNLEAMRVKSDAPESKKSAVLHRQLHENPRVVQRAEGNWLVLENGHRIFDGVGGAAVACIGHGDKRPVEAARNQMSNAAYCSTVFFSTQACEDLCRFLIDSTHGHMARAYIVNSGQKSIITLGNCNQGTDSMQVPRQWRRP